MQEPVIKVKEPVIYEVEQEEPVIDLKESVILISERNSSWQNRLLSLAEPVISLKSSEKFYLGRFNAIWLENDFMQCIEP